MAPNPVSAIKDGVDMVAALTVAGGLLGLLPPIAAGFAIVWYVMQMIDRGERKRKEREAALLLVEEKIEEKDI